jgi:hypothetical protein
MENLRPGNTIVSVPEPDWSHFAFSNGVFKIADAPLRANDGEWRPCLEWIGFEEMQSNFVCPQYIETPEPPDVPRLLALPFGFLKLREDHAMQPRRERIGSDDEDRFYMHYSLPRGVDEEPAETAEDWLARWTQQFELVEREGERLVRWLRDEVDFFVSDLFLAWEGARAEAREGDEDADVRFWPFAGTLLGEMSAVLRVMCTQRYSDQEMYALLCILGRGMYPGRVADNWQSFLLLIGESRTGKGVLIEIIFDILGAAHVTTVKSDQKDLFSLADLPGKRAIVFEDLSTLTAFHPDLILKMAAHETEVIRLMKTNPYPKYVQQKLFIATNNTDLLRGNKDYGQRHDPKVARAMLNRAVMIRHHVGAQHEALLTDLGQTRKAQSPQNFVACMRAYQGVLRGLDGRSVMGFLPRRCLDPTMDMRRSNTLRSFLDMYCVWENGASMRTEDVMCCLAEFNEKVRFNSLSPDFRNALVERSYQVSPDGETIMHLTIPREDGDLQIRKEVDMDR